MKIKNNLYLKTSRITRQLIAASIISITLSSCGSSDAPVTQLPETEQPLSELSVSVNPAIVTEVETLPAIDTSGIERRVAVIRDELGKISKFVENELIIMTNDTTALQGFITRWDGVLVKTIDIQSLGLAGGTDVHIVRVNTDAADGTRLRDDLLTLDSEARGATEVSSDTAYKLLAAGAREAVNGLQIGMNWIGSGDGVSSRSTTDVGAGSYSNDAFDWNYMDAGSIQDIGVTEAWYMLDQVGLLNKTVDIAILDMGFAPMVNGDIDPSYVAISNVPYIDALDTRNVLCADSACEWHGTNVANAAMGLLDNGVGAAGPAGPVANPILIYTLYDYFTGIAAITQAIASGADIINMSYSAPIPGIVSWSAAPFQFVTALAHDNGKLLFASAGNDSSNVDGESCIFGACWENTLHIPCESRGVICVGGLAPNSKSRDRGSNYGTKGSVDIFAPFWTLVGSDPNNMDTSVSRIVPGTSFSSPYAAGVAALIWAANSSLTGQQVEDIMMRTAHTSPDATVPRYVNAQEAVRTALGEAEVNITSPVEGSVYVEGSSIEFAANASSTVRSGATFSWATESGVEIGTGNRFFYRNLSPGSRTITVTATFADGFRETSSVTINIDGAVPSVTINQPVDGTHYYLSETIQLSGTSVYNARPENGYMLYDTEAAWLFDGVFYDYGHNISVPASYLGVGGPYTVRFQTDTLIQATDEVVIYIDPDPTDFRPEAEITSPAANTVFTADQADAAGYYANVDITWTASDAEDGSLPFSRTRWTTKINGSVEQSLDVIENVVVLTDMFGNKIGVIKTYKVKLYAPLPFGNTHELIMRTVDSAGNVSLPHNVRVVVSSVS